MVGKVGGITSKCPPFLPYNKIPRHLLKSIRSYVKGTNIYVIRGGGATSHDEKEPPLSLGVLLYRR